MKARVALMKAAAARKSLQENRESENLSKKRARHCGTLTGWLTGGKNPDLIQKGGGLADPLIKEGVLITAMGALNLSIDVHHDASRGVGAIGGGGSGTFGEERTGSSGGGLGDDIVVVASTLALVQVSSDSSCYVFSKDNPNFVDPEDQRSGWSDDEEFGHLEDDDDGEQRDLGLRREEAAPPPKKKTKNHE